MFNYIDNMEVLNDFNWLEVAPADFDAASEVWEMVLRQRFRVSIWKMQAGPIDWYTLDFYEMIDDAWSFDLANDEHESWEHLSSHWLASWDEVVKFISALASPSVKLHDL